MTAFATGKSFSIIKASVLYLMSSDMSPTCLLMLVQFKDGGLLLRERPPSFLINMNLHFYQCRTWMLIIPHLKITTNMGQVLIKF